MKFFKDLLLNYSMKFSRILVSIVFLTLIFQFFFQFFYRPYPVKYTFYSYYPIPSYYAITPFYYTSPVYFKIYEPRAIYFTRDYWPYAMYFNS